MSTCSEYTYIDNTWLCETLTFFFSLVVKRSGSVFLSFEKYTLRLDDEEKKVKVRDLRLAYFSFVSLNLPFVSFGQLRIETEK